MGILLIAALIACLISAWVVVLLGAWAAMGVDRLLAAISQQWRARRAARRLFQRVLWLTSGTQRAGRGRRAVPGCRRQAPSQSAELVATLQETTEGGRRDTMSDNVQGTINRAKR